MKESKREMNKGHACPIFSLAQFRLTLVLLVSLQRMQALRRLCAAANTAVPACYDLVHAIKEVRLCTNFATQYRLSYPSLYFYFNLRSLILLRRYHSVHGQALHAGAVGTVDSSRRWSISYVKLVQTVMKILSHSETMANVCLE